MKKKKKKNVWMKRTYVYGDEKKKPNNVLRMNEMK